MFENLISTWNTYREHIHKIPYYKDMVQAYGLAFAHVYNSHKNELCQYVDINIQEFSYSIKNDIMKILTMENDLK